jgi:hypothetical protein
MSAATVLKKVRTQVEAKGFSQSTMTKMFKEVDTNHNGVLSRDGELPKLLKAMGLKLTSRELKLFAKEISQADDENVMLAGFLSVFTPKIAAGREAVIDKCFKVLSPSGKDLLVGDLRERLGGGEFAVVGGRRVCLDEFLADLQKMFDPVKEGILTVFGFRNYYRNISSQIKTDAEFKALLEAAWTI